jgi:agmatine deiminase
LQHSTFCFAAYTYTDATGVYSNFLRLNDLLLVPIFDKAEDEQALRLLAGLFPAHRVVPIATQALAPAGGLLHCVTWEL